MHLILRQIVFLLLAFSLGLFGATASATAAGSAGLMPMVICADAGARTIWLDGEGNPADPAPADCCNCDLCQAGDPVLAPPQPIGWHACPPAHPVFRPAPKRAVPAIDLAAPLPRGPPQMPWITAEGREAAAFVPVTRRVPASLEFGQVMHGHFVSDRRANT